MSHDYHMTWDSCLLQICSPVEFVYVLYFIGEVLYAVNAALATHSMYVYVYLES